MAPFLLLFPALVRVVFRIAAMVIFLLAMVITILMTIASAKMMVSGWTENGHLSHRRPFGGRTGKRQKAENHRPVPKRQKCIFMQYQKKLYDASLWLARGFARPVHRAGCVGANGNIHRAVYTKIGGKYLCKYLPPTRYIIMSLSDAVG